MAKLAAQELQRVRVRAHVRVRVRARMCACTCSRMRAGASARFTQATLGHGISSPILQITCHSSINTISEFASSAFYEAN